MSTLEMYEPEHVPGEVVRVWRERQEAQDRFMSLTAGPEWFSMMAAGRKGSMVAVIRGGESGACSHGEGGDNREAVAPRAILPLLPMAYPLGMRLAGRSWCRRNLPVLRVCGGDLIEDDVDPSDLTALWSEVTRRYPAVQGVWFDHVGSRARDDKIRRSGRNNPGFLVHSAFRDLPHYRLKLPPTLEEFKRMRSSESLKKIQGRERALGRAAGGSCRLVELRSPADWGPHSGAIGELMSRTWQSRRLGHQFDLASLADVANRGWLRSFLLMAGNAAVAFAFCFQGANVLVYEQIGYNPDYSKYSPGTVLLYGLIERLYECDTPECVDFGEGAAAYKSVLANEMIHVSGLLILRRTPSILLLAALDRGLNQAADFVRRARSTRRRGGSTGLSEGDLPAGAGPQQARPGRVMRAVREAVRIWKERRRRDAIAFLLRKCWSVSDTLVFERAAAVPGEAPGIEGVKIVCVKDRGDPLHRAMMDAVAAEGWGDLENFESDAVCYVACLDDRAVGAGWRFLASRLLRRIGYPASAVYMGGFHVVDSARGKGIYPAMLLTMCRDVSPSIATVVVETAPTNRASQRGLAKAGFVVRGRLRTWTVGGLILQWRLEPWISSS